ncbi:hypothetical protein K1719_039385 [Acacia pycnantha]|nr:hypothetical protein K1719_039385 [Acacia pycnantha]
MRKKRTVGAGNLMVNGASGKRVCSDIQSSDGSNASEKNGRDQHANEAYDVCLPTVENENQTSPGIGQNPSVSNLASRSVLHDITNIQSSCSNIQSKQKKVTEDNDVDATPSCTDHEQLQQQHKDPIIDITLPDTIQSSYLDEGDATYVCQFCGANMWLSEWLKSRNGGGENLDPGIVKLIKGCLDRYNSIVKQYRCASEIIKHDVVHDVNIRLIRNSSSSGIGPQYNMPTASELAALIYPLFFHYGDNGYDPSIEHGKESLLTTKKKTRLTPRELNYIRKHQKELRVDLYSGLSDAVKRGETDPSSMGRRVILPSSFTGGARYMIQNYQDAMAICAWAGYPDIFLTFTCNPMWPEIIRHCNEDGLKPCDRPDVLSRIFNMKLHKLMHILKDEKIFGTIKAGQFSSL